jgi:glycosyltransferase involved in cell wall biosynthesis
MRIAYVTAGAAGMFCGSCMHDNTLAAALMARGHECLLVPTYTPITTDEPDVSMRRVFFGGISVFLEQKFPFFRRRRWLDALIDLPAVLRWVTKLNRVEIEPQELGELFLSMLRGQEGHQAKEIDKLIGWLERDLRPQLVNLTNVLISGIVPELKRRLGIPIVATLQGDDIFLEALPEPIRKQAIELIARHCGLVDGFIATSAYYADFMSGYLGIQRGKIDVVYPGINLTGHGLRNRGNGKQEAVIGYFARICPEKGLHVLAEAFTILRQSSVPCRLRASGWLGAKEKTYLANIRERLGRWGLELEHSPAPDHASKVRFFAGCDILSVPTVYREPKGLYVLESLANRVPVVQPRHGSFPELVEQTGGGLLVNPQDPQDLAAGLRTLLDDPTLRDELGRKGRQVVEENFSADMMASRTVSVYQRYV